MSKLPKNMPRARSPIARRVIDDDINQLAVLNETSPEFPPGASSPPDGLERRDFVKLLAASMALAGLSGCVRAPDQEIHPLITGAPNSIPGVPLHYATAMTIDGLTTGVIVESHDGRPTKIEGNPEHPASLGGAGIFEQASILELYDPRRAQSPFKGSAPTSAKELLSMFTPPALANRVGARGAALGLVLEPTASPLTASLLARVRTRFPDMHVFFHSPLNSRSVGTASQRAFGKVLIPQHDFRQANVVVALGADPFASAPFHLRYARDFSTRRRTSPAPSLHVAEVCPSPTSTLADTRIAVAPEALKRVTAALFARVARDTDHPVLPPDQTIVLNDREERWVANAAADLIRERSHGIVIAGPLESEEVQLLTLALNDLLQNVGTCVWYTESPIMDAGLSSHDVRSLSDSMDSLDTLIVLQGNVCYTAPPSAQIERKYAAIRQTLYLGSFHNETARLSKWHLPGTHYLEEWGLERAYDGSMSIVQPLIAPLYDGRTIAETLALISGARNASAYSLTHEQWNASPHATTNAWDATVRRGVAADSALPRVIPVFDWRAASDAFEVMARPVTSPVSVAASNAIELVIGASRTLLDGRFADNPWLQELPDPVTKLTWDNAALFSPATAKALNIVTGQLVRLETSTSNVELPALVVPGHADGATSLTLGYGRRGAEHVADGVGVDVNVVRTMDAPYRTVAQVRALDQHHALAITQTHFNIEHRAADILGASMSPRDSIVASPDANPTDSAARNSGANSNVLPATPTRRTRKPLTLYEPPAVKTSGFGADQWAMTIDLDQCTGCSACVVACQSENNIPTVGRDDVLKGREMHWMRIDRYVSEDDAATHIDVQPMLCQHCEKAPCEYVCPVNATMHSDDGLNEMVYNRCVGTRFCSNNCPYKVRRFNWFEYNGDVSAPERMQKNPEVTVRARGVMEKCTFCVQRVRRAQMDAELAGEPVTGPVLTACQQTCPTQAIVFGSLTAPNSEVAALTNHPRAFSALEELGTVPRVRYLARTPRDPT